MFLNLLTDNGYLVMKFFFHISQEEQKKRLKGLEKDENIAASSRSFWKEIPSMPLFPTRAFFKGTVQDAESIFFGPAPQKTPFPKGFPEWGRFRGSAGNCNGQR